MRYLPAAVVIAIAATAIAVSAAASAAELKPPKTTRCPILTATQWQLPYAPNTKGTTYSVTARGTYTCKQADTYIKKLVATKVIDSVVKGGPHGWWCTASASKTGLAYTGQCSTSKAASFTDAGPGFTWSVG